MRSAIRDVGRALGLSDLQAGNIARSMQWWDGKRLNPERVREAAEKLYGELLAAGIDVLFDDRDARPEDRFGHRNCAGTGGVTKLRACRHVCLERAQGVIQGRTWRDRCFHRALPVT